MLSIWAPFNYIGVIKLRKNITFIKPSYIHKRSSLWHSPRQSEILNSRLCQWILDSNLKWDSGFLKLYSGFQSPGFQIPQAKSPEFQNPGSLSWGELWGLANYSDAGKLQTFGVVCGSTKTKRSRWVL